MITLGISAANLLPNFRKTTYRILGNLYLFSKTFSYYEAVFFGLLTRVARTCLVLEFGSFFASWAEEFNFQFYCFAFGVRE